MTGPAVHPKDLAGDFRLCAIAIDTAVAALQLGRKLSKERSFDHGRGRGNQTEIAFGIEAEPVRPRKPAKLLQILLGQEMKDKVAPGPEQGARIPTAWP